VNKVEDFKKTNIQTSNRQFSEKSSDHKRPNGKIGGKPHKNGGKGKDRQKGMVNAFVQGKGQNAALKWLMDSRTPVSIFLITGVKFEGLVSAFDAFTISITDVKHHQQMIYKDKISTITVKKAEPSSSRNSFGHQKKDDNGALAVPADKTAG
jgi:RNA chaperone Hfq